MLQARKYAALRKVYPSLNQLTNREIGIYIEIYKQAIQEKDASMITLAVCGEVIITLTFFFFNARFAEFHTGEHKLVEGNGYVKTVFINFIAGSSASITIFLARPIINIFGKADEVSIYDPLTLLGCFMAGLVSIGASC